MSRHRVKTLAYDEDDDEDYNEYDDELDPEEQAKLENYTNEVLQELRTGQPAISTTTRQEVQEALWHYYNDVEKTVNYLRSKKLKEMNKKQVTTTTANAATKMKDLSVPSEASSYPIVHEDDHTCHFYPSSTPFSAIDFFRDAPWLNVPRHRRADILIEPLYPRLGLLGGAAQQREGKMSKLAALAAARKKNSEKEKLATPASEEKNSPQVQVQAQYQDHTQQSREQKQQKPTAPRSLSERLALNNQNNAKVLGRPAGLSNFSSSRGRASHIKGSTDIGSEPSKKTTTTVELLPDIAKIEQESKEPAGSTDLRAAPSKFAATIIGNEPEPGQSHHQLLTKFKSRGAYDVLQTIYLKNITEEAFNFAGPSPDDVVLNAQSASKGLKSKQAATGAKSSGETKNKEGLSSGMKALTVEPMKVKSKNLDVLAEYKKSKQKNAANFVVIGHVDAGKSTLMGRLLSDLNAIDQRTMEKYRREAEKIGKGSFAFAWVLDQGSEERARGVTIDIATNKFETDSTRFTIVDAPGHRDFIPNMIAGASQADFAVLVIDAGTGNFESGLKGQTKEHALLVRSMGVQKVVVAVNKMDAVSWSKDRFDEIEQQISSFLTTAGFQAKNLSFIPCSGYHGDNITTRSKNKDATWYTGPLLIETLETSEPFSYALEKPLRLTIGDVFRGGVQNPLSISGRIDAGSLQVGDSILIMPSGESALIRNLETDGEASDWAVAGQNAVLHLANIDPAHLRSGDIVCSASSPIRNIQSFTTKVLAFDHLMPMQVDIHRGRLHVSGRISKLVGTLDKSSGVITKKKPKIIAPGSVARIVVEMDQPVPLEAPARIVLRAAGSTVAAGLLE